jgi:hypothetical protein
VKVRAHAPRAARHALVVCHLEVAAIASQEICIRAKGMSSYGARCGRSAVSGRCRASPAERQRHLFFLPNRVEGGAVCGLRERDCPTSLELLTVRRPRAGAPPQLAIRAASASWFAPKPRTRDEPHLNHTTEPALIAPKMLYDLQMATAAIVAFCTVSL